jgi:valyl-tRNA synthetase
MHELPFNDVYLNGTVRDQLNRKMSKSLGNGIDPLEVVQLFGADALRYTVIAASGIGNDVQLDNQNLAETFAPGRNFSNKIWNAGRFALMNLDEQVASPADVSSALELADRWILSRLNAATRDITKALDTFRFHEAAETLHRFFWSELADWYLELAKPRLRGDAGPESRRAAQATLAEALDVAFRLMHPLLPFISEALWRRLPLQRTGEPALIVARWPEPHSERDDPVAEQSMDALMELITSIRSVRTEYNVPPAREIPVQLSNPAAFLEPALRAEERAVKRLARVSELAVDGPAHGQAGAHIVLRGGTDLFIPLAGLVDVERERARLQGELERMDSQLRATEAKLNNEQFRARAPEQVVAHEVAKAESLRDQRTRLSEKLKALE